MNMNIKTVTPSIFTFTEFTKICISATIYMDVFYF